MRFLRLDFRDDLNSLDLHPLITVVPPLEQANASQLFEAVRRLSGGSTVGLRGLVEHQGLLLELDASSGDPLRAVTTSAAVLVSLDGISTEPEASGLQAEIDRWERQAAIDAATVEEIRSHLDLAVKARAATLRASLGSDRNSPASTLTARKLRLAAVRKAFDAVHRHDAEIAESDPILEELIERWDRYRLAHSQSESHLRELSATVTDAERAVAAAKEALARAQELSRPVLLTAEQEARLETLYDQSSESSLFKRGLSSEDQAEMQALLHSVGVESYTEYSVFRMSPTVPADKLAAVQLAESELQMAEQRLQRTTAERDVDDVAGRLQEDLERLKADCQPYLGVLIPSDIGAALRAKIVRVENPQWLQALNGLRDALSSNDLHPPCGFEPTEILGWTDSWLRAQESLQTTEPDPVDAAASDAAEQERQMRAVSLALVRHERALAGIDRAERNAFRSAIKVRELKGQLHGRGRDASPASAAEVMARVVPVAEQVLSDIGGSVPIAIVGELPGLPAPEIAAMMAAMEEVARQVQIILITANDEIAAWAGRAGLERAAVVARATSLI